MDEQKVRYAAWLHFFVCLDTGVFTDIFMIFTIDACSRTQLRTATCAAILFSFVNNVFGACCKSWWPPFGYDFNEPIFDSTPDYLIRANERIQHRGYKQRSLENKIG